MHSAPLEADRLVGDRYVLETLIAQGGMGEVWRARHKALKSLVAIKFLHRASSFSQSTRKRFLTEAQVTANLKTRHAVQVFDFGVTEDELPYLVMEYLEGETLEKRIAREGSIAIEEAVNVLRQAARALDRAHALGIVHRDFKPENIVILADEEGGEHVKVVDFGIAKILGDLAEQGPPSETTAAFLGSTGGVAHITNTVGTPYYMAPEQVQDSSKVGPAADIWAFGVVAYECLTGRRPFDDVSIPMLLAKIVTCERPPPASTLAEVPSAFDDWFDIACAHDPEERFPDAQTAIMALATALDVSGAVASISRTSVVGPAPPKRVVSPLAATLDARRSARPPKRSSGAPPALVLPPEVSRVPVFSAPERAALPPPPLSPSVAAVSITAPQAPAEAANRSPKVQTYAPIEPAPRLSRVGRGARSPWSLALIGGSLALAVATIAIARREPLSAAPTSMTTAAEPLSASASPLPSPGSTAAQPSAAAPPDDTATPSSSATLTAAPPSSQPSSSRRALTPKKSVAPAKSAPPAYQLPPLGL